MKRMCIYLVLASLANAAFAGDLNPPAGPVGATMKPLSQVEPRIAINATNTPGDANSTVKITQSGSYYLCADLVGTAGKHGIEIAVDDVTIDLNGFSVRGVPSSLAGISADTSRHRVGIRNGSIVAWGFSGISLTIGTTSGVLVDHVRAAGNGDNGIAVARDSYLSATVAEQNGGAGIFTYYGTVISDCVAVGNGGGGINANAGSVIRGCTARDNQGSGINGFSSVSIEGCVVMANHGHGIEVGYDCVVRGNVCTGNGVSATVGAGIFVGQFLRSNRIEDNQLNGNDFGLKVDGDNNFIVRNTARGNTSGNYSVAASNEFAPVITNPGSSNFSTATPWSNFAY